MGWFSDETLYTSGISISQLIPKIPESPIKAAVLSAIRNDGSIVNNLVAAREQTMFGKAEDFLSSAKTNYYRGMPSNSFPSQLGDVMPIVAVRENLSNLFDTISTPDKASATRTLKKLGLSFEGITDGINASPEINLVDDAYVMLGFNVWSDIPCTIEYFFKFIALIYNPSQDYTVNRPNRTGLFYNPTLTTYSVNFADVTFDVNHNGIHKVTTGGYIGPIGTYTRSVDHFEMYESGRVYVTKYDYYDNFGYTLPAFILRHQVTADTFEEYRVINLTTKNTIRTAHQSKDLWHFIDGYIVKSSDIIFHPVYTWGTQATFIIPLFKSVLDDITPFKQDKFIADSVLLYVHTESSTTIRWYQSEGFLVLAGIVLSIAVVFFTGGFGAGFAQGLLEVIMQVVVAQAIGIVSKAIIEILSPIVGEAAATAIVGIASILIAHAGIEGIKSLADLPWAEDLLKASLVIVGVADSVNASSALQLTKDVDAFNKSSSAFGEELDRANKLLGTTDNNLKNSNLNNIINAYETPEEFYTRTIHQGNIGVMGLDAITNYTTNKLRLPKQLPTQLRA